MVMKKKHVAQEKHKHTKQEGQPALKYTLITGAGQLHGRGAGTAIEPALEKSCRHLTSSCGAQQERKQEQCRHSVTPGREAGGERRAKQSRSGGFARTHLQFILLDRVELALL